MSAASMASYSTSSFSSLQSPLSSKPSHHPLPLPVSFSLQFRHHATLSSYRRSPVNRKRPCSSKRFAALTFPVVKAQASVTREPMVPPYNVLITGSTKGIGYALAKGFLEAGDNVVICSRSADRVESAVQSLRKEFGEQHVWGTTCDVREGKDVKNLVAFAQGKLKYIDLWINNAGSNAYSFKPLAESSDEDLIEVVTTNTLGLMICCREAIIMMLNQPRGGHIFNIDGAGSDGRPTPRFAAYGATKRSVVHLTKSLQAELQMQDVQNVVVHNLSPGMVTTDLLMSGATTKQAKFFINVLAEPPEVVAEYLVPNIRSIPGNGSKRPTYIRFLTGLKAYSQIFSVKWVPKIHLSVKELHLVQEGIDTWLKIEMQSSVGKEFEYHWSNPFLLLIKFLNLNSHFSPSFSLSPSPYHCTFGFFSCPSISKGNQLRNQLQKSCCCLLLKRKKADMGGAALVKPFHNHSILLLLIMFTSLSLLPHPSHQQLTIQQLLIYPSALSTGDVSDICNSNNDPSSTISQPSLTLECYQGNITQLHFIGTIDDASPSQVLLPQDFSTSSFFDSLAAIPTLKVLSMVSLGLWGPLPPTIGQLSSLEILNLSSNSLSGVLPMEFSSLKNLQTLILDHNQFTGVVPHWLTSLSALTVLSLKNNSFHGFLPNTISELENVRILSVANNHLSGEVPDLHNLTNLQILDLGDNYLGPQFPNIFNRLVSVVLRNNSFKFGIPVEKLASARQLQKLDISLNGFEGPISAPLLLSLPSISYLDVSKNKFTGMLSENMSCSGQLSYVDLSSNRLSGEIPTCLEAGAVVLYANNCLSTKKQKQNPLYTCHTEALAVKVFPRDEVKHTKVNSKVVVASGAMGGTIGGIALIGLAFLFVRKAYHKSAEKSTPTRLITENVSRLNTVKLLSDARYISETMKLGAGLRAYRTFALEELKEATNNFNASNLLSEDTHDQVGGIYQLYNSFYLVVLTISDCIHRCQVYRGKLNDGTNIAIKSLTLRKKQNQQTFTNQIELASKLRHSHLVSVVGHCSDCCLEDSSNISRMFLIFEFFPNGTLRDHISGSAAKKLNWMQRIGAAIGVARGIQFLHTGIVPGMFSINLKITDVLVDHDYHAKISSFNLPPFDGKKASVGGAGQKQSFQARQQPEDDKDVEDLGVILLEVIVGRPIMYRNEVTVLKDLVSAAADDASRRSIVDPNVQKECSNESLKTMVDTCIRCLTDDPSTRPSIGDVLWNLQFAAQVQESCCLQIQQEDSTASTSSQI
ncbi:Probable inactive leucine-rich repeat receptor-like protein kinase At3g03770 [Linum grandiflorum]